jgi:sec-independent protein translocase protein TatA
LKEHNLATHLRYNRIYNHEKRCPMLREIFTPGHLLLIAAVALIFFGPSKLPELGRGFGKMLREFKSGTKGIMSDDEVIAEPKQATSAETANIPKFVEAKSSESESKRQLP